MSDEFTFKKFSIRQDKCAMKVGTDGVLLGAWAEGGSRILDIGTGTGLIALMMAQRFADADVTAIDIEEGAWRQACGNFAASPFAERLHAIHSSLQDFQPDTPFDTIVCNPPFFERAQKAPDAARTIARHNDTLPSRDLFSGARRLLSSNGVMSVIMPTDNLESFISEAFIHGFFAKRRTWVSTIQGKKPKRVLMSFVKRQTSTNESQQNMYSSTNEKTGWYEKLVGDFYL